MLQFDMDADYDLTLDLRDRLYQDHPELCLVTSDAPGVSPTRSLGGCECRPAARRVLGSAGGQTPGSAPDRYPEGGAGSSAAGIGSVRSWWPGQLAWGAVARSAWREQGSTRPAAGPSTGQLDLPGSVSPHLQPAVSQSSSFARRCTRLPWSLHSTRWTTCPGSSRAWFRREGSVLHNLRRGEARSFDPADMPNPLETVSRFIQVLSTPSTCCSGSSRSCPLHPRTVLLHPGTVMVYPGAARLSGCLAARDPHTGPRPSSQNECRPDQAG